MAWNPQSLDVIVWGPRSGIIDILEKSHGRGLLTLDFPMSNLGEVSSELTACGGELSPKMQELMRVKEVENFIEYDNFDKAFGAVHDSGAALAAQLLLPILKAIFQPRRPKVLSWSAR